MDERFFQLADRLVAEHEIVLDRPRGSAHPRYADLVYPIDYGYLAGTTAGDGEGIDVWRGTLESATVTGVIVTIDARKRDAEVKLLVGCTRTEAEIALAVHNDGEQAGMLVCRTESIKSAGAG